jgi:hypothetical protein
MQYSFRNGRNSMNTVLTLQQIIEEERDFTLPLYVLFIEYDKAYDSSNLGKL